jgi:RNA polymerase sigma factor (sigma-70 family)
VSAVADASWLWEATRRVADPETTSIASNEPDPLCEWVRRLQAGESEALEPLINQTQAFGWRIAYAILQNRQEVEDALQDAYLSVFQNIGQLQHAKAFYPWFKRIIVHRCLRLKKRTITEELQHEPPAPVAELEPRLDVADAFKRLAPADRTVLGLREILDYSYDEIATSLEVPLSTVKNRLFNARQRLFRFLTGQPKGGPKQ